MATRKSIIAVVPKASKKRIITSTSKRHILPSSSKFKQQKLSAWQPILKGNTALPIFFITGFVFIPIGVVVLMISSSVKEFSYDYTYCRYNKSDKRTCAQFISEPKNFGRKCRCNITVHLESFEKPVFIYYGLSNFYQNHRRFVRSRDDDQLYGTDLSPSDLRTECDPYRTFVNNNSVVYGIAPCGAIANSLFNDTFTIMYMGTLEVDLIKTGIALKGDRMYKFNNPDAGTWKSFTKPPNWRKHVWELDPFQPNNNGYNNEDLIVWMRTSATPNFRKLYRRVSTAFEPFTEGLPEGRYMISIDYNYPVAIFDGQKKIIISTTSVLGGKNPFFGIAYIIVGSINIIVGVLFYLSNHYCGTTKKDSEKVKVIKLYWQEHRHFSF